MQDNLDVFKDKRIFFISDSDLDGISSSLLAIYYIEPRCKFIYYYNEADRSFENLNWTILKNSDIIIFTDTTPSLELYNQIKTINPNIYIFDHHETGKSILGEQSNYYYDDEVCAAKGFYRWINEGKRRNKIVDEYINLVNTYDSWKQDSPLWKDAKGLHNVMWSTYAWGIPSTYPAIEANRTFIDNQLKKFRRGEQFYFTTFECQKIANANKKEEETYNKARIDLKKRKDNQGNIYGYTECRSKLSLVASRILKNNLDLSYLVIFNTFKKSDLKMSLRSLGFNCADIAEKYSGGGHKQAASFSFDNKKDFDKFVCGNSHLI